MNAFIFPTLVSSIAELEPFLERATVTFFNTHVDKFNMPGQQALKQLIKRAIFYAHREWALEMARQLGAVHYHETELMTLLAVYKEALKIFIRDKVILEIFLKPLLTKSLNLDSAYLIQRWKIMNLIPLPANFEVLRASEAYLQTIKKSNIIINYHNSIKMPMMPLDTLKQHWPECDLEHYLVQIKKNYDFLEPLPGLLPIPLTAIFMPHYVQENRQPRTSTKTLWEKLPQAKKIPEPLETELKRFQVKSESIFAVLAKPNQNKLVLLGAPALGKSTLAHYLLITLLEAGSLEDSPLEEWLKAFSGYLPVLIELEHYFTDIQAKQYSDFLEYFYHCSSMCPHSLELFKEHFRQHPSFVIFDGLDKVSEPILRQEITQEIIDFAYEYPQAYIIVTSRSWGYQGREFQASNFKEYIIQPFKLEQIKSFTHRWLHQLYPYETHKIDQICNQLNTLLQSAPALQQLASQPWLLTLVLSLAQQQPLSTKRGQLCQQLIHLMCQHSSLNLPQTEIAAETLQLELLSHLAQQLQNTPEGLTHNYLSTSALTTALSDFFQRYFVATQADEISQAFINQLAANHFIFCGFGDQHYGFIHRLFLEYFCAVNIVTQFESGLSLETLKQSFFQAHYQETTWHEILKFICALVAAPVAGQLIDTLIPSPQDIYGQTAEFILAIQCLAEVSDLKAVAATAETVLARICYWFEETEKNTAESIHEQELSFAIHALPAIEAIGTQWPRREQFLSWLAHSQLQLHNRSEWSAFIRLIVALWPQEQITKKILMKLIRQSTNSGIASLILPFSSLVHHFGHQTEVETFIRQCAQHEQNNIRKFSVSFLANYYSHSAETLSVLQHIARADADSDVRCAAVNALAKHYCHHSKVMALLYHFVNYDSDRYVRHAAVSALTKYHLQADATVSLLQQVARVDTDSDVRRAAVKALSKYAHRYQVLSLLKQIAFEDIDEDVRRYAVGGLVSQYELMWQKLLSKYFNGSALWLDSKAFIDEKRVNRAAQQLNLTPEVVRQHYQAIAQELPLKLSWSTEE